MTDHRPRTSDPSSTPARRRFQDAAHRRGAAVATSPHLRTVLDDEVLTIDVAQPGDDAISVLSALRADAWSYV